MDNRKHLLLMAAACAVSLFIIIFLPFFGVTRSLTWIVLLVMLAFHLLLLALHHRDAQKGKQMEHAKKQGESHGCH